MTRQGHHHSKGSGLVRSDHGIWQIVNAIDKQHLQAGVTHNTAIAWLLSIREAGHLESHPQRGALFENWVISELLKARFNAGLPGGLYFWRDRSGHEVDVLIETAKGLIPVEIKSGQTVNADFFKGIEGWLALSKPRLPRGWLVYGGNEDHQRHHIQVLSWRHLPDLTDATR